MRTAGGSDRREGRSQLLFPSIKGILAMKKSFNLLSTQGLAAVLLAVLMVVIFFVTPLHDRIVFGARGLGASFMWDVWHGGVIHWNGYTIHLEKGRYGWTIGDRGGLSIISRTDMNGALIDIWTGESARIDYAGIVKGLCSRRKCTDIREGQDAVNGMTFRSMEYAYIDENQVERQEAYMRLDTLDLLLQVSSSRSAFSAEKSVALSLIAQIYAQNGIKDRAH